MKFSSIIIGFFFGLTCHAQWFTNISSFTTQKGLSNNTITCLAKDATGFLWIGTHEGLNRYDGTAFINVLSNNQNNLASNNINSICFIDSDLLAIATDAGLCLLNTKTLQGKRINLPFNKTAPASGYFVEDLLYDKQKRELWVATWHGLFVLDGSGNIKRQLMATTANLPKGPLARHLLQDRQGDVYFYSMQFGGFYYPNFPGNAATAVERKDPSFTINNFIQKGFYVRSVQHFEHESIIIVSRFLTTSIENYIAYRNLKTGRQFTDPLVVDFPYEKQVSSAYPLSDTVFLVNSYFGEPLLYNTNDKHLRRASEEPLWFTSWPDGIGTVFLRDEQFTWIGTAKGLLQSTPRNNFFKTNQLLTSTVNREQGLVSYNYGLYQDHRLWVSCMGAGLFALDTATNQVQPVFTRSTDAGFSKKRVSAGIFDAGNTLWLNSVYGPVEVNTSSNKLSPVNGLNKDPAFDDLSGFPFKDSRGFIWSTLPDGVCKFDTASGLFTNYKSKLYGGNFPLLRAGPKTEDATGNIWFARQDTLVRYDRETNRFSVLLLEKEGKAIRPVSLLASDGADILYISVAGALGMYHISTGKIDLVTKQTGVISTVINDIVSDAAGNAWIATEAGLVFYNKLRKKFSSFTKADGLPDDNIVGINFVDPEKKTLFLGFAKNYCLFDPSNFLLEKSVPQNVITGIEVNGEEKDRTELSLLSYKQNSISFSYTGINFNQGELNNYACILDGFDQDWKYQGTERKINYVNLPPGKYTFKVKTANHQGEWNEQAATFSFEIKPPFWQRWWFIALMIALVLASLVYFIRRREKNLQRQNDLKLQMSELRMQALRAQMNPHFIFNSLNSIQNYILSNNTMDAASYLSKFAKLIRRILDQSKHNFLPLSDVIDSLRMYVEIEAFRFNNEFNYKFNIEEKDELLDARIPPMLLQPFVENAILHGLMPKKGDKTLLIECKLIDGKVMISINDNGVGRGNTSPKAGHESQGGKLTDGMLESLQQIKNIKASITIVDKENSGQPAGTTVELLIPLN